MKDYKLSEGSSVVLDLIRGLSAQLVVIGHGLSFFGVFRSFRPPNFPWMQNIAVLVFFLLSGFLITYSLVGKISSGKKYSFKHYFIDRFSRIYMAFIPALLFVFLLDYLSINISPKPFAYSNALNIKTFIGNLLMLQEFPLFQQFQEFPLPYLYEEKIPSFGSARILWTLAIEWWIYLFFGYLLLVFCKKTNLKSLLILSFFSIVPLFNLIDGRGNGLMVYWFYGSVVYLISTLNILGHVNWKAKIVLMGTLVFFAYLRISVTMKEYEPIFAFILAFILYFLVDLFKGLRFNKTIISAIRYNASYSYTLYLTHYSIIYFVARYFKGENPYLLFAAGFLISNLISILIGRYTEIKLTRKIKKKLYSIADKGHLELKI